MTRLLALSAFLGACLAVGAIAGLVVLLSRWLWDRLHYRLARVIAGALVALAVGMPAAGQEEGAGSRIHAGAWCTFSDSEKQVSPDPAAELEGGDGEGEEAEGDQEDVADVGCDAGVAASLIGRDFRQGRLSLIGALGAKTVGVGAAWTFGRQGIYPMSVAVGVVAPYSGEGIHGDEWAVAVGATVAVFGRR